MFAIGISNIIKFPSGGIQFPSSSVGVKIDGFTMFDRNIIKKNWKEINDTPLTKAGLLVRKIEIQSLRKVNPKSPSANQPAAPGKPPKSRSPRHPMRLIYSVPNSLYTQVVIGPIRTGSKSPIPVPYTQEVGGRVKTTAFVHTNRFNLNSPVVAKQVTVTVAPHPFAGPALAKGLSKLPPLWHGSIGF